MIVMNEDDFIIKTIEAGSVFTPGAPIDDKELFANRAEHLPRVVDTIIRPGLHAIMFGERGVGKTSLANMIQNFMPEKKHFYCIRVNSAALINFTEIWRDIFRSMDFHMKKIGYLPQDDEVRAAVLHYIDQDNPVQITPLDVRFVISQMPSHRVVIVIDEFDRIEDEETISKMADTIKNLSDSSMKVTLILVAVADSVLSLINKHPSLSRALVQIRLPRMSDSELRQIITKGMSRLGMTIDLPVIDRIVELSRGLPHYTHLLALESVISALQDQRLHVDYSDLDNAITAAFDKTTESTKATYLNAVETPRGQHYHTVLLGCALAKVDERGYFAPSDVRQALKDYLGVDFALTRFNKHLHQFASDAKGNILTKVGSKNKFKYRFKDPIMQPYVTLEGIKSGRIDKGWKDQEKLPLETTV